MKNIVNNPNQSIDNFLTLPFINLGGFEETVFDKNSEHRILLGITVKSNEDEIDYNIILNPKSSFICLNFITTLNEEYNIDIAFPYAANKNKEYAREVNGKMEQFAWNGFTTNSIDKKFLSNHPDRISLFNLPLITCSEVDFVPIRRGFTKPYYGNVPLQSQISTEEEIATLLATDDSVAIKVGHYLEKIVGRSFSVYHTPGIANFYLQIRDTKTGFTSELVIEGLGTNQLVTMLAKILQPKNKFICIDEPEIHLHPSIIDKLVSVIVEISEQEGKQFLCSTHSEHFITSLLNSVAKKEISNGGIKVNYLTKQGKETKVEPQAINEKGQIEGGLKNFLKQLQKQIAGS